MGCCQSTASSQPSDESSPPRRAAAESSPTATNVVPNDPPPPLNPASRPTTRPRTTSSPARASPSAAGITPSRPNQPIRAPTPPPTSPAHVSNRPPPWTRRQLALERDAFFDTRVSGRREIWSGLRVVADLLRAGDVAQAQGFLDALGLTCPYGRVASGRATPRTPGSRGVKGGVFDERGEGYDLPAWVLVDPLDIVPGEEGEEDEGGVEKEDESDEEGQGGRSATAAAAAAADRRRDEKGKGRAPDLGDPVHLRARLSDRGSDVVVPLGTRQPLSAAVRGIQAHIGPRRVQLVYLGRTLNENQTLEGSGWVVGHVVNALVYEE